MSFSSRDNVELAIDKIQTKLANKSDWKQRYKVRDLPAMATFDDNSCAREAVRYGRAE